MLTTNKMDNKTTNLLPQLTTKQKKVVLSVVETFAEEQVDSWKDDGFIAELDRRTKDFETGKGKTVSLEYLEAKARNAYKANAAKQK